VWGGCVILWWVAAAGWVPAAKRKCSTSRAGA
jgi:hypothetical protein